MKIRQNLAGKTVLFILCDKGEWCYEVHGEESFLSKYYVSRFTSGKLASKATVCTFIWNSSHRFEPCTGVIRESLCECCLDPSRNNSKGELKH